MKTIRSYRLRFPAFFLFALISFQGIGWVIAWQALHLQAKLQAHAVMREQQAGLTDVTLSIRQFEQVKLGKKEILLDGCLFDYRNPTILGDSIHLELYHDSKEQQLLGLLHPHFSKLSNPNQSATPPLNYWVAQWLTTPFLTPETASISLVDEGSTSAQFNWLFPLVETNARTLFQPPRAA